MRGIEVSEMDIVTAFSQSIGDANALAFRSTNSQVTDEKQRANRRHEESVLPDPHHFEKTASGIPWRAHASWLSRTASDLASRTRHRSALARRSTTRRAA